MNKILNKVIESRNGDYLHAIEVSNVCDIECIVELIINEFTEATEEEILDFFNTIEVYFLEDEEATEEENKHNETEVYNFNFNEYIKGTI